MKLDGNDGFYRFHVHRSLVWKAVPRSVIFKQSHCLCFLSTSISTQTCNSPLRRTDPKPYLAIIASETSDKGNVQLATGCVSDRDMYSLGE